MEPDPLSRVRELFEEAVGLPVEGREALLESCDDDLVRREVRALLQADEKAERDRVAQIVGEAALELDAPGRESIGPYRIVREMGRGGMGRVYLAERDDGEFEQTVALKLLGTALASDHLIERFRRERQILARLQHPNIARLLDGGVTEDGQPYFALELVDGEPITRYCDRNRLSVDRRLELFEDVCQALVYAHANLVVHRDLKPDNILTTHDGQVRLLDFGIAKVLEEDGRADATRTAMMAMTPAYASPEQVRGEVVGTASDVYSLGVVLYELLTGTRPYDVSTTRPSEIERVVGEVVPARPSTRIGSDATTEPEAMASISAARSTDPLRLRRLLHGDLDVICLKALRKEPERRYGSVQALLDDIVRHREGRPVLARPATLRYRAGKAIRRHRWAFGAAAAVVVSSTTLVAFYTARLADERDRARQEAAKAGEVADFLQQLFAVSDPSESLGETVTARELLDEGARRIDELEGQPEVQASMMRVIGEVYGGLGLFEPARDLLTRSLALNRELYGEVHEDVALNEVSLASVIQDGGDIEGAGPYHEAAVETLTRLYGARSPRVSEAREQYAFWLESNGDYEEAEAQYRLALESLREALPAGDERIVSVAADLGNLLRQLGRLDESEGFLREALAGQRALYGSRHPDVASTARALAALLRDEGEYEESEALYEEVIQTRREVLGPLHPELANTLNSYSILLARMGETERSLAAQREFLSILEQIYDEPHPSVAAGYHNLAMSLRESGDLDEAEALFRRSIEMQDIVFRPGHPNRAFPRIGLASVLREKGDYVASEPLVREALAVRREALPPGHRYIGEALSDLGATLAGLGRHGEAEPALLEALEILVAAEGPDAGRVRVTRARLVELYDELGRPEEAARYRAGEG